MALMSVPTIQMQIDGDCLGEVTLENLRNGVFLRPPHVVMVPVLVFRASVTMPGMLCLVLPRGFVVCL